jgi:hypothetical protein
MIHVAPAILLAAAVAATQPIPLKRPVSADERTSAEAYLKESLALTGELFEHGKALGKMLADVAQGRTKNGDGARTELKSSLSWIDGKIDQLKKKPAPTFSEMSAYRKVFLGYLAWEREFFVRWTAETLKVLEDPKLSGDEKKRLFIDKTNAEAAAEKVQSSKVDAALADVNAALNRK